MPRTLPPRPNLEQLKAQARELQRAYNAGEQTAQRRFAQHLPSAVSRQTLADGRRFAPLAQALAVLAREHGFASWPLLRRHVDQLMAQPQPSQAPPPLPRTASQAAIALMAEQLAGAAERRDLGALFTALQIGKGAGDAVRALLVEQGRFAAVVDALLTGVEHDSARVRFLTAQAMDHWADERCAAPLWALLHDPVPRVRWAALHSLQCDACKLAPLAPGGALTTKLIALALADPSVKVRRVATWELGQLCPDPRAVAALEQICAQEHDPTLLRNARHGLRRADQGTRARDSGERQPGTTGPLSGN